LKRGDARWLFGNAGAKKEGPQVKARKSPD